MLMSSIYTNSYRVGVLPVPSIHDKTTIKRRIQHQDHSFILAPMVAEGLRNRCRVKNSRRPAPFPEIEFYEYAQAGRKPRNHDEDENEDSYRRNWGGRVRWMDCPLSTPSRCARDFGRRLGSRQLSRLVRRRDARDPRDLWTESALHEDGGAGHAIVERE